MFLRIETVGFITEKKVRLEKGFEYIIKSKIPEEFPFTVAGKDVIIKRLTSESIVVLNGNDKKSELRRLDIDIQNSNLLIGKDFSDFKE